jgi:hypothetical protein
VSSGARVGVIAGAVAALAVAAALLVAFASMRKSSDAQMCAANLRVIYMAIRGGELLDSPRWDHVGTGREFLYNVGKWPAVHTRPFDPCCPVKGGPKDEIDYRGPALPPRKMAVDDAFLADRPGNHGPGAGGNVAFKDGRIVAAKEGDDAWARAARTTAD